MALIVFGGGVSGASGKSGGSVYARNRAGSYMRNWAKPVNPGTVLQSGVRQDLAAAAAAYQMLTYPQVTAWNAYAVTMTRLNRLGQTYVPSGRQIFIECYLNCKQLGGIAPQLTLPGPTNVSPAFTTSFIAAAAQAAGVFTSLTVNATMTIPSGQDPVDCYILYYSAPTHPAQKSNVNKQRRLLGNDASDAFSPLDIKSAWNAYFGSSAQDGHVVDVWLRGIDTLTNLATPLVKLNHVVA